MIDHDVLFFAPSDIIESITNRVLSHICLDINNCTRDNADMSNAKLLKINVGDLVL